MGSVGGLLGLGGGAGGTGFGTNPGVSGSQINNAYTGVQGALTGQQGLLSALQGQNGIGNQSQVYNQLQGIANGQGPNPAQAMLNQATGANVANQASLMAGQRGAASNVGLIARQAGQQGANIQQQAAGQGATMQANQALGALGQAGQLASTQAANQIGQTNANLQGQQGEQSSLMGANSQNNAIQGQLANTTLGNQPGIIGGVGQGVAGIAGSIFAQGGQVQRFDMGGMPQPMPNAFQGPQSMFGQFLTNQNQAPIPTFQSNGQAGTKLGEQISSGLKNFQKAPGSSAKANAGMPQAVQQFQNLLSPIGNDQAAAAANQSYEKGGKVPAMVSPGERFLKPGEAKAVAVGKASPMKVGEQIPGQAKVKGNSYQNDTVPKNLDVGGVVIPRSVMESKNPEKGAAEFVRKVMAKKKAKS